MPLRVAHVTATFPPYWGGTGNVCFYNARELVRLGHEVHVFTAAVVGAPASERMDGITVHRLPAVVRVGNAPLLPNLPSMLRGFDLIHLHYPFILGAEMVRMAANYYHTPLVISFHNDLIGNGLRGRVFTPYQRLSALVTVRGAARLCAVSLDHYHSSILRRSLAPGTPPVVEVPNGVDTSLFCPSVDRELSRQRLGIPSDVRLLLFVAALDKAHYFKGLGTLLKALESLPDNVWLLVVGDGDLRQDYERQAMALGIADRTVFVGAVENAAAPPLYRSADVTVFPTSPPESFGLVLIESLACGTPVVTSNIPGVRTVVDVHRDGLLVEPGNHQTLAQAVSQILANEDNRLSMGKRGRVKVEAHYSWTKIGVRLEGVYRDVLAEREGSARPFTRGQS